jgi:hypothetical protein
MLWNEPRRNVTRAGQLVSVAGRAAQDGEHASADPCRERIARGR